MGNKKIVFSFQKLISFVFLLIVGIIFASIYGIIHDQLTYTISNEYFTKFKFQQFGIINLPDRLAVIYIGIMATWWMGLISGFILGSIAFIQKDYKKMLSYTLEAFVLTIICTFVFSMIGLLFGFIFLANKHITYFYNWYIPENITNLKNFIAVGSMHNFSYIGGLIGTIIGIVWQLLRRYKK